MDERSEPTSGAVPTWATLLLVRETLLAIHRERSIAHKGSSSVSTGTAKRAEHVRGHEILSA